VDKEAGQVNAVVNAYGRRERERVSDSGRCGWRSAFAAVSRRVRLAGEVQRTDGCPGAVDGLVEGGGFKVDTAVAELSRR